MQDPIYGAKLRVKIRSSKIGASRSDAAPSLCGFRILVDSWTQTDIGLFHGDRIYLHALTNEMVTVPDTDTLSINQLPLKVANSQINVEFCLNYSTFTVDL